MSSNNQEYYFIDNIYDDKKMETLYYVVHQKSDGSRVVVSRAFRKYKSAETLCEELNDHLYTEDEE